MEIFNFRRSLHAFFIGALLLFIKASLAHHPLYYGVVNEGLAGNPWFPHELEDRSDCFRFDAGDTVEIGDRVTVVLLRYPGRQPGANIWRSP